MSGLPGEIDNDSQHSGGNADAIKSVEGKHIF